MSFVKDEFVEDGLGSADRLECRLRDQVLFKTLLQCAHSVEPEYLTLKVQADRISYYGIDSNHVALVNWELGPEAFEFFEMTTSSPDKEFLISLNLELVQKVLKISRPKEVICLLYDSTHARDVLELSFLDPSGEASMDGDPGGGIKAEMSSIKTESGEGAGGKRKKTAAAKTAPRSLNKMNQFSLSTRPAGSERDLELPPIKEESTKVLLPCTCYRYAMDSILELNIPDQKNATVILSCPQETIMDAGKHEQLVDQDIVRFGSSNASGDTAVDFIVCGTLETGAGAGFAGVGSDETVLLTRGEGFGAQNRSRISNKFVQQMGTALPIAKHMVFHLCEDYPIIVVFPLNGDQGVIRWVISPRAEEDDGAGGGEDEGAQQEDADIFAEDEFSDG